MYQHWTPERAQNWWMQQEWGCGFNYLPRTAVNWLEMWQEETFDIATLQQELKWAQGYGYNALRTNLPFTVWAHDRDGLINRIDHFLSIASSNGLAVMLTLLDDCAFSGDEPFIGQQKPPCRACITARAQEAQAGRKCSTLNVGRRLKLM